MAVGTDTEGNKAPVTLTASAADTDGTITQVAFYNGATLVGTATTAPYSVTLSALAAGTYSFTAVATDNSGATTTSSAISVKVNAAPSVTLTSPTTGASFTAPATVNLAATASDADGTIAQVEFYAGTTLIATVATAPYTYAWTNVPQGSYVITARAIDNDGGITTSAAATITVNAAVGQLYFIHPDHLNTPRLIADSTQTTIWKWEQAEPFGNNVPNEDPDGNSQAFEFNLRFPGQYFDRETNLAYNYFRDYDSAVGRYVQSDPIGLRGGVNTFAYADGEPLSYSDPEGLQGVPVRPMVRPSTREMVRHPELIQPRPTIRENAHVRDEFMEWAKGGNDFMKGYRQDAMDRYLREQGIEPKYRRLPPTPPGCVLICPDTPSQSSCGPAEECKVWCGPRMSAF